MPIQKRYDLFHINCLASLNSLFFQFQVYSFKIIPTTLKNAKSANQCLTLFANNLSSGNSSIISRYCIVTSSLFNLDKWLATRFSFRLLTLMIKLNYCSSSRIYMISLSFESLLFIRYFIVVWSMYIVIYALIKYVLNFFNQNTMGNILFHWWHN